MPSEKEIDKQAVEKDYNNGMKYKDLAIKYGVTINTIKSWKQRHGWDRNGAKKGAHKTEKRVHTKKQAQREEKAEDEPIESYGLDIAEMTAQQRLFADEYLTDLKKEQAAIRAGYSPRSAHSIATELLKKPAISDYIAHRLADRSRRLGISLDRTLDELAKIGYANPKDFINPNTGEILPDASPEDLAAITSVKFKASESETGRSIEREVKFTSKLAALQLLHKYQGLTLKECQDNEREAKRLAIEHEKLELERKAIEAKNPSDDSAVEDDGFIEALEGKAPEVWTDEKEETDSKNE
jgi:phage terminase small subunit